MVNPFRGWMRHLPEHVREKLERKMNQPPPTPEELAAQRVRGDCCWKGEGGRAWLNGLTESIYFH
jgi:hypothetical protein